MSTATFDPLKELVEVRTHRFTQRRKLYRRSKLDRYRTELVALRRAGASSQDIATWLKMKHRLTIHRSSVDRYLGCLPELAAEQLPATQPPAADPAPPTLQSEAGAQEPPSPTTPQRLLPFLLPDNGRI